MLQDSSRCMRRLVAIDACILAYYPVLMGNNTTGLDMPLQRIGALDTVGASLAQEPLTDKPHNVLTNSLSSLHWLLNVVCHLCRMRRPFCQARWLARAAALTTPRVQVAIYFLLFETPG